MSSESGKKKTPSDYTRAWRERHPEKAAVLRTRELEKYHRRMREEPEYHRRRLVSARKYQDERARKADALKDAPCVDCGNRYPPCAMDWDHRDPATKSNVRKGRSVCMKTFARGHSWERTLAEIAKCDLVCSNCHRIRTHNLMETRGRQWKSGRKEAGSF